VAKAQSGRVNQAMVAKVLAYLGVGLIIQGILTRDTHTLVIGSVGATVFLMLGWGTNALRAVVSWAVMMAVAVFLVVAAIQGLLKGNWLEVALGTVGLALASPLLVLGVHRLRR
jgi:hypothetical protein